MEESKESSDSIEVPFEVRDVKVTAVPTLPSSLSSEPTVFSALGGTQWKTLEVPPVPFDPANVKHVLDKRVFCFEGVRDSDDALSDLKQQLTDATYKAFIDALVFDAGYGQYNSPKPCFLRISNVVQNHATYLDPEAQIRPLTNHSLTVTFTRDVDVLKDKENIGSPLILEPSACMVLLERTGLKVGELLREFVRHFKLHEGTSTALSQVEFHVETVKIAKVLDGSFVVSCFKLHEHSGFQVTIQLISK